MGGISLKQVLILHFDISYRKMLTSNQIWSMIKIYGKL